MGGIDEKIYFGIMFYGNAFMVGMLKFKCDEAQSCKCDSGNRKFYLSNN